MVLTLARGGYCPKEHLQHVWMTEMERQFAVAYTRLVTISTDWDISAIKLREKWARGEKEFFYPYKRSS